MKDADYIVELESEGGQAGGEILSLQGRRKKC